MGFQEKASAAGVFHKYEEIHPKTEMKESEMEDISLECLLWLGSYRGRRWCGVGCLWWIGYVERGSERFEWVWIFSLKCVNECLWIKLVCFCDGGDGFEKWMAVELSLEMTSFDLEMRVGWGGWGMDGGVCFEVAGFVMGLGDLKWKRVGMKGE